MPTRTNTLPVIRRGEDLLPFLTIWNKQLNPLLASPPIPRAPFGFTVTNQRGGNLLSWSKVNGADGYEVLKSTDADFDSNVETIVIDSPEGISYFDSLSGSGAAVTVTRFYKVRATAGTRQQKHFVKGLLTGILSATTIDPADVATASSTSQDTTTGDDQPETGGGGYRPYDIL